ncbi:MAG: Ig-like domain-containing protein [Armatimonadia bacterium]
MRSLLRMLPITLATLVILATPGLTAGPKRYLAGTFVYNGRLLARHITPVKPPPYRMPAVTPPIVNKSRGVNILSNVPKLSWCFGCAPTAAAMLFGYYDNSGYSNMYAGPTNGGVFPQTNQAWPDITLGGETRSQCPLSATRKGLDGRTSRGHVDDYWIRCDDIGPDPWIVNQWAQHVPPDCTADFMGSSQSAWDNMDGATSFILDPDGSLEADFTGAGVLDGCHGMRLFAESRGAVVETNFSQYIDTEGLTYGFTYAQYMAEIDAGRPVLIHVDGHTMCGVGYDSTTKKVYVHDTWDWSLHQMTWGGSYNGLNHYGVTVVRLKPVGTPLVSLSINNGAESTDDLDVTLKLARTGGDAPTEMRFANDDGDGPGTWTSWEPWATTRAWTLSGGYPAWHTVWMQARNAKGTGIASDRIYCSVWETPLDISLTINNVEETTYSLKVTLGLWSNSSSTPTQVRFSNGSWDGPGTWSSWQTWGETKSWTLAAGDSGSRFVFAQARNNCAMVGTEVFASIWYQAGSPTTPTAVTITPSAPGPEQLRATATGSTDSEGHALTYKYQWQKKNPDGAWAAWGYTGRTLAASNVKIGDTWRVRAQAYDGTLYSPWKCGSTVTIVSMAGVTPAPSTYNVPVTTSVFASFRWPVQQSTVTSRIQLKLGTSTVIPTVMTWVTAERKVKLRPRSPLLPNTYYRINIDPGITCTSGRVLGWGENYWFKTAPATSTAAVTVAAAPTAGGAELTVNLASAATVRTVISNIAGRVVAKLPERDLPAGVSSLLWNGKSTSGSKVPAGTYLVRVVAIGNEGTQTTAVAPLQIR